MYKRFEAAREPMSSYTHFLGAVLSLVGIVAVAAVAFLRGTDTKILISSAMFLLSIFSLYCTSAYYHFYNGSPEKIFRLRKLDHAMIFVLIAGSYTPVVMRFFPSGKAEMFIACIWGFALFGIVLKVFYFKLPRLLSTLLYVGMGWSIMFDLKSLFSLPSGALLLLAAGGLAYTIGGVIYAIKKPNLSKAFGFHEIFHLFVIIGSFFHFLTVIIYVL